MAQIGMNKNYGYEGQDCMPTKQTQISEQQGRIGSLMTELSERISKIEQRFSSVLRLEDIATPCENEKNIKVPKVELASWLDIHACDIERQIIRLNNFLERCEL